MAATSADRVLRADISVAATTAADPAVALPRRNNGEYLFAALCALTIVTIATPLRTIHALLSWKLIALLPLATCQDLFLVASLAWLFHGLFAIAKRPWATRLIAIAGWTITFCSPSTAI